MAAYTTAPEPYDPVPERTADGTVSKETAERPETDASGQPPTEDEVRRMAASIDLSDLDVAREQYPLVCEVARHGGGTLDFDIILDLRRVTGIPDLNYEMYAYIDGKFDDDLLQICEDILDGTDTESLSRIQSYIQAAQPSASKELLMGLNLTLNDGQHITAWTNDARIPMERVPDGWHRYGVRLADSSSRYENDFDPETAKPLEEYADYATVTAEQEATARKDGKVEILGPEFKTERVATYNWVLSLKRPVRADEPGDDTDKDGDGIVDDKVEDTAIFTDTLGRAKETTEILTVTTKAQENATANKPFHDTALIQGNVVAGTQIEFELWQRAEGDDVSKDKLVTTTDRVTLKGGETKVDSPDVTVKFNGSYYWVEKVYRPTDQSNPDSPVEDTPFHVGERRLPNESVTVTGGLSQTGAAIGGAARLAALLLGLGGGTVAWNKRRSRDPRGRHAA